MVKKKSSHAKAHHKRSSAKHSRAKHNASGPRTVVFNASASSPSKSVQSGGNGGSGGGGGGGFVKMLAILVVFALLGVLIYIIMNRGGTTTGSAVDTTTAAPVVATTNAPATLTRWQNFKKNFSGLFNTLGFKDKRILYGTFIAVGFILLVLVVIWMYRVRKEKGEEDTSTVAKYYDDLIEAADTPEQKASLEAEKGRRRQDITEHLSVFSRQEKELRSEYNGVLRKFKRRNMFARVSPDAQKVAKTIINNGREKYLHGVSEALERLGIATGKSDEETKKLKESIFEKRGVLKTLGTLNMKVVGNRMWKGDLRSEVKDIPLPQWRKAINWVSGFRTDAVLLSVTELENIKNKLQAFDDKVKGVAKEASDAPEATSDTTPELKTQESFNFK